MNMRRHICYHIQFVIVDLNHICYHASKFESNDFFILFFPFSNKFHHIKDTLIKILFVFSFKIKFIQI